MKKYLSQTFSLWKKHFLMNMFFILILAVVFAIDSALGMATTGTLAMAAGGSQYRNSQVVDGAGWDRKFTIAAAYAALLENVIWTDADNNSKVFAWYNSSTAFSTNKANYDNFPVGTVIVDIQDDKMYIHDAATTWKAASFS